MQFWYFISIVLPETMCCNIEQLQKIIKQAFWYYMWRREIDTRICFFPTLYSFMKIISEITHLKNYLRNLLHLYFLLSFFHTELWKEISGHNGAVVLYLILFNCLPILWRKISPRLLCGHNFVSVLDTMGPLLKKLLTWKNQWKL